MRLRSRAHCEMMIEKINITSIRLILSSSATVMVSVSFSAVNPVTCLGEEGLNTASEFRASLTLSYPFDLVNPFSSILL